MTITQVTVSQPTGYEGWIASDGRAYLVFLYEGGCDGDINGEVEEEDRGRQPLAGGLAPAGTDRSSVYSAATASSEHLNVRPAADMASLSIDSVDLGATLEEDAHSHSTLSSGSHRLLQIIMTLTPTHPLLTLTMMPGHWSQHQHSQGAIGHLLPTQVSTGKAYASMAPANHYRISRWIWGEGA